MSDSCAKANFSNVRLTPRERQLISYIVAGQPNKVIAIDFNISLRTAEAHRARIFKKLGVKSTLDLACLMCYLRRHWAVNTVAMPVLSEPSPIELPFYVPKNYEGGLQLGIGAADKSSIGSTSG